MKSTEHNAFLNEAMETLNRIDKENADRMRFMKQYAPKPDKYAPCRGKDKP